MLAYVFFHSPGAGVEILAYEAALRRFHAALVGEPPPGFAGSTTYRMGGGGYADWYLVESSAALDRLNEAAVSAARAASHDAVAHMSADGAGKLLALVSGRPRTEPSVEIRLSKPRGMSYPDFYERLAPWTGRDEVSLWRRMMVLGPAPEFCLVARLELQLPAQMTPESVQRTPI